MNEGQRRAERIYGALMVLYSKEFRNEYSDEMIRSFGVLYRDSQQHGAYTALTRLWLWALLDLFRGVLAERGKMSGSVPLRVGGLAALASGAFLLIDPALVLLLRLGLPEPPFTEFVAQSLYAIRTLGELALIGLVLGLYFHLKDRLFGKWRVVARSAVVLSIVTTPLLLGLLLGDLTLGYSNVAGILGVNFFYVFALPGILLGWTLSLFLMGIVTLRVTQRGVWRWLPLVASVLLSPFVANRLEPIASYATGHAYNFNVIHSVMPIAGAMVSLVIAYAVFSGRLLVQRRSSEPLS